MSNNENADRHLKDIMIYMTYDGNCTLTFATFFKSTCEIDVTYFPFDVQTCLLEFGSWSEDKRLLQLKVQDYDAIGDRSEYEVNGEWELAYATLLEGEVR